MNAEQIIQTLTVEQLRQGNPTLAAAVFEEGRVAGYETGSKVGYQEGHKAGSAEGETMGLDAGRKSGAETERLRIKAIEAVALPGHTTLIEQLKWDGQTTGAEAAMKVLQAEKETRGIHLAQLKQDVLAPIPQPSTHIGLETNPDALAGDAKTKQREHKIAAHMSEHKVDYRTAAFAVSKAHPDLFKDR